jgi:DNA polymerase/3'-5' exonuclease PolX
MKIPELFQKLAEAYEREGDVGRSTTFARAAENVAHLKEITCGADIANVQGCGPSLVNIVDEYMETGRCERLEDMVDPVEARKEELHSLSKPKNKEMAKAFVLTDHPYVRERAKEVKDVIKSMDCHLRVLVAHQLRRDGYLPSEVCDQLCEYCQLLLDETCSEECTCDEMRERAEAEAIGCTF